MTGWNSAVAGSLPNSWLILQTQLVDASSRVDDTRYLDQTDRVWMSLLWLRDNVTVFIVGNLGATLSLSTGKIRAT